MRPQPIVGLGLRVLGRSHDSGSMDQAIDGGAAVEQETIEHLEGRVSRRIGHVRCRLGGGKQVLRLVINVDRGDPPNTAEDWARTAKG